MNRHIERKTEDRRALKRPTGDRIEPFGLDRGRKTEGRLKNCLCEGGFCPKQSLEKTHHKPNRLVRGGYFFNWALRFVSGEDAD